MSTGAPHDALRAVELIGATLKLVGSSGTEEGREGGMEEGREGGREGGRKE